MSAPATVPPLLADLRKILKNKSEEDIHDLYNALQCTDLKEFFCDSWSNISTKLNEPQKRRLRQFINDLPLDARVLAAIGVDEWATVEASEKFISKKYTRMQHLLERIFDEHKSEKDLREEFSIGSLESAIIWRFLKRWQAQEGKAVTFDSSILVSYLDEKFKNLSADLKAEIGDLKAEIRSPSAGSVISKTVLKQVKEETWNLNMDGLSSLSDVAEFLEPIFGGAGLDADRFPNRFGHLSQWHRNKAPSGKVVRPPLGTSEKLVQPFLVNYFSIALGQDYVVHDIHTVERLAKLTGSRMRPDFAIIKYSPNLEGVGAKEVEDGKFCVLGEVKKEEEFNNEDHLDQAKKYGMLITKGFYFRKAYIIMASQFNIRFMRVEQSDQFLVTVFLTRTYPLGTEIEETLLAIRAFIREADSNMTPNEPPKLRPPTVPLKPGSPYRGDLIPLEVPKLAIMTWKGSSTIWSMEDDSKILKQVDFRCSTCFEKELEVLQRLQDDRDSEHGRKFLSVLYGYDAPQRLLLIGPLGMHHLGEIPVGSPWDVVTMERKLEMFLELDNALDHLHRAGFVHRDVRPANIIFHGRKESCKLVLIDFGIAERLKANKKKEMYFKSNVFEGTIGFVPTSILSCYVANQEMTWTPQTDHIQLVIATYYIFNYVFRGSVNQRYNQWLSNTNVTNVDKANQFLMDRRINPQSYIIEGQTTIQHLFNGGR